MPTGAGGGSARSLSDHEAGAGADAAAGLAGLPVELVTGTRPGGKGVVWWELLPRRSNGDGKPAISGEYGYCIRFPEPVPVPVAVGYAAHFGIGAFTSVV